MNEPVMMACGHAANAKDGRGNPCCAICIGITPKASRVVESVDLTGRMAKCTECGKQVPSSMKLAFFEHRPAHGIDKYYCGCRGWN